MYPKTIEWSFAGVKHYIWCFYRSIIDFITKNTICKIKGHKKGYHFYSMLKCTPIFEEGESVSNKREGWFCMRCGEPTYENKEQ